MLKMANDYETIVYNCLNDCFFFVFKLHNTTVLTT